MATEVKEKARLSRRCELPGPGLQPGIAAEISCVAAVIVKPRVRLCEPWVMVH
jgi:hypothetical protein